ncbi:hypothetical protein KsCSTR_26170 [Candidatus Kuenenia stuttgartiensis]|uniref:Uncharacterized protein n=1 Tax=Kuenenia stuttgartiensis TaxID=174633 RepID=A0A6G7GR15_KUEST|nr:hypothetical protein KsCSTR_26170 [Candidatus Kuenenia stuttgartiensis]
MNALCSLHEFIHIQVKYPPTAFFFTKNREGTLLKGTANLYFIKDRLINHDLVYLNHLS